MLLALTSGAMSGRLTLFTGMGSVPKLICTFWRFWVKELD
jgi:hypothetical protein